MSRWKWFAVGLLVPAPLWVFAYLQSMYAAAPAPSSSSGPTPQGRESAVPTTEMSEMKEELPAGQRDSLLRSGTSLTSLESRSGALRGPSFQSEAVKTFTKEHPNSPLRFVPADANVLQLHYLEQQAEIILKDWQERRDALWSQHRENLLAFTVDPSVIQNDKDRQAALKSLVNSLWPGAMP